MQNIRISSSSGLYRNTLMLLASLLILWALYQIRGIIILVLFSGLFACALYPPIAWLQKKHWPKALSIIGFYLIFVCLMSVTAFLTASMVVTELRTLQTQLPVYLGNLQTFLSQIPNLSPDIPLQLSNYFTSFLRGGLNALTTLVGYVLSLFSSFVSIITVLALTFYLLLDTRSFEISFLRLIPQWQQPRVQRLLSNITSKVGSYVRGQLLLMVIVGSAIWLGLSLIGIRYAFLLGILAFFFEIIPLLGPLISLLIGLTVTLLQAPNLAVWVVLLYISLQQLENYILVPRIMEKAVDMKPFWILLSLMAGATLGGVAGVILAIPIAVTLQLIIDEFYVKGTLSRQTEKPANFGT